MPNKESAVSFLKMVGSGDVTSAYDKFVDPEFIHHNQYFVGDRQSLMLAMQDAHQTNPNTSLEVKHIYEDGNNVITHSYVAKEDLEITVVHIFRFNQNHKIVELWDVGQLINKDTPNKNTPF